MADFAVVGHLCLDLIPELTTRTEIAPGRLIAAGPALFATGGPVSNVGLALHRLGASVRLVGKVGDDAFGDIVRQKVEAEGEGLGRALKVSHGESTSYSVVISPPGVDRTFLHHPGANDTFVSSDVEDSVLTGIGWVHFGYPTLMARMFAEEGGETADLLQRARAAGAKTCMDVSLPDPAAPAGQANWRAILGRCLPFLDVFAPNAEEIAFMLGSNGYAGGRVPRAEVMAAADRALALGAKVVAVKAGDRGLYVTDGVVRTWAPCYRVQVAGTTGSGDATVAGFLYALHRGESLEAAARAGTSTGACGCECPDAISGIRPWTEVAARLAAGWDTLEVDDEPE